LPDTSDDFSLLRHLRALRRQLWLIALCLASGLVAAGIVVLSQSSVYRASMKILIGQGGGAFAPANATAVDPFTATMANLLSSDVVAATVIRDLNLKLTTSQLLSHLHVTTKAESAVLEVSYDSSDPSEAVAILRDAGNVFISRASPNGALSGPGTVSARIFDPAHLGQGRISPTPGRTLGLAALFSVVIGIVLALVRQALRPRLDGADQAEEWFKAPVVGTLPAAYVESSPLAMWFRQTSESESLRVALSPLIGQLHARRGGKIMVTSADRAAGNSVLAAHLAAALASVGERVVCVELDDRPPTAISCLRLGDQGDAEEPHGLMDVVGGRIDVEDALQSVWLHPAPGANGHQAADQPQGALLLELLPIGTPWSDASPPPSADAVVSLTSGLASGDRFVVVDAPPVLLFPQTLALAMVSDMILVLARKGSTTRADAETIRALLTSADQDKIGVILAEPRSRSPRPGRVAAGWAAPAWSLPVGRSSSRPPRPRTQAGAPNRQRARPASKPAAPRKAKTRRNPRA
jgi:capsular polysaccharide biosynthesis protein/MinD-like ATPase involved in chromosome partitioning or flagellar assembly